jgi:hypothetical protein
MFSCVSLWDCRLEHIGRYDRVRVARQCGRVVLLAPGAFDGLPNYLHVVDLKYRLRCDHCGERGKVMVSVLWAGYSARRG